LAIAPAEIFDECGACVSTGDETVKQVDSAIDCGHRQSIARVVL